MERALEGGVTAASQTPGQGSDVRRVGVFVLSDIRLYRHGLAEMLGRRPEIDVLGMAATETQAIELARKPASVVVLLDMAMPGALNVARRLVRTLPTTQIVALTVAEEEDQVLACAEAGVAAYVTRESSLDDLVATIQGVERNEMFCSPRMAASLFRRVRVLAAETLGGRIDDEPPLTARELEIVALLDAGLSNKEIARRLFIEVATVKNHVHNILEKLRVRRRSEVGAIVRVRGSGSGSFGGTGGSRI